VRDGHKGSAVRASAVRASAVRASAVRAYGRSCSAYLNDCRLYGGAAVLDIRVTNRSSYLLDYWEVNIEVSDASGKFIGTSFNNGLNLAADGNVVSKFNLRDVSCGAIKDKKVSLIKIVTVERGGQKNFDAVRFFKLVVE